MDRAEVKRIVAAAVAKSEAEASAAFGSDAVSEAGGADAAVPMLAEDVPTFAELPHQPLGGPIDADAAFLGVPFDGPQPASTTGLHPRNERPAADPESPYIRWGSDEAPPAIRRGSRIYSFGMGGGFMPEYGVAIADHLRVVDAGDADVREGSEREAFDRGAAAVSEVASAGAVPLVIGGDHTTSGIALHGIHAVRPGRPIGVIVFDAHYDLFPVPEIWAGSQWIRAMEAGILPPSNLVVIGLRGTKHGSPGLELAEELGVGGHSIHDVQTRGIDAVVADALEQSLGDGVDDLYLSLDVDSIDPAYCPAQKYPDPGGLTSREVCAAIHTIVTDAPSLCGFDTVCFGPAYDYKHHGAMFAARSYIEVLGALALRRSRASA